MQVMRQSYETLNKNLDQNGNKSCKMQCYVIKTLGIYLLFRF